MRSCVLVRSRPSRACTLRASVRFKRSCIAAWATHGVRSESCDCASASRKRPHLSSNLTSRTFGGYRRQRSERETGELTRHTPRADFAPLLPFSSRWGLPVNSRDYRGIQIRPSFHVTPCASTRLRLSCLPRTKSRPFQELLQY